MRRGIVWLLLAVLALTASGCRRIGGNTDAKPVIYLYPEETTEVRVELDYAGELTHTWPAYEGGWTVTAEPDGTLWDEAGNQYSYLFWEGTSDLAYDFSQGFCVAGEDTGEFLRETLSAMGLTAREYNEFIVYWLPQREGNAWTLISFPGENYAASAALTIDPAPDSLLRVFMVWRPLEEPMEVEAQEIVPFVREGFTVVEWGGSRVDN